jgi:hypothetical protein
MAAPMSEELNHPHIFRLHDQLVKIGFCKLYNKLLIYTFKVVLAHVLSIWSATLVLVLVSAFLFRCSLLLASTFDL